MRNNKLFLFILSAVSYVYSLCNNVADPTSSFGKIFSRVCRFTVEHPIFRFQNFDLFKFDCCCQSLRNLSSDSWYDIGCRSVSIWTPMEFLLRFSFTIAAGMIEFVSIWTQGAPSITINKG